MGIEEAGEWINLFTAVKLSIKGFGSQSTQSPVTRLTMFKLFFSSVKGEGGAYTLLR